jgi:hypothetical protein
MRVLASLAALLAGAAAFASGQAGAVAACGHGGYSYAGFQSARIAHGVRADLVALGSPLVENGHAAAWVGVGGPGQGAGGSDAWLQVGYATFGTSDIRLYFESNRPGQGPHYTQVEGSVEPGTRHRVAVLEVHGRKGWWKAWVDGKPVSEPMYLPGSSGRWAPIATAETWDGGRRVCNLFSYRFGHVSVAGRGGAWRAFRNGSRFQDPGYQVVGAEDGFLARADEPLPTPSAVKAPDPAPAAPTPAPAEVAAAPETAQP